MSVREQLEETLTAIRARLPDAAPRLGIVLGSGLGSVVDALEAPRPLAYETLPHFPKVSVAGHAGRLWLGRLGGLEVAVLQGRAHGYEGNPPSLVAYPTRVLGALGIKGLLVTNAAGGVNTGFRAGDLMALTDHLNLTGQNPLTGPNEATLGPRFPDMSEPYDGALLSLLDEAANQIGVSLRKGVYAQLPGPSYETPAEVRMLRILGADAVGMSTVPEVVVARHQGVRVSGVSCITNVAAGLGTATLSHEEVTLVAAQAAQRLVQLVLSWVGLLSSRSVL